VEIKATTKPSLYRQEILKYRHLYIFKIPNFHVLWAVNTNPHTNVTLGNPVGKDIYEYQISE